MVGETVPVAYTVLRWDNWSECDGKRGLSGLEALLNEQFAAGRRLVQLAVQSEDIFVVVFEDAPTGEPRDGPTA